MVFLRTDFVVFFFLFSPSGFVACRRLGVYDARGNLAYDHDRLVFDYGSTDAGVVDPKIVRERAEFGAS